MFALTCSSLVLLAVYAGCGGENESVFTDGGTSSGDFSSSGSSGFGESDGSSPKPCQGLECNMACSGGVTTNIDGIVYEPAGKIPLYNVVVYVPNAPLPPIVHGASCDKCASQIVNPVASAVTDAAGHFKLTNVPVGEMIPLVMQVGKWRRQITVKVEACKDNVYNAKDSAGQETTLRLPRSKAEGDLPLIGISTGNSDPLVCLLPRLGIDASEFTAPSGTGSVQVFTGNGGNIPGATNNDAETYLWDQPASLAKYDMVLLSCEGSERNNTKSASQKVYMRDYLNAGGRVFATHYHYTWFKNGPADVAGVATWGEPPIGVPDSQPAATYEVDTTFPKGKDFGDWLKNVSASPDAKTIPLQGVAMSVNTVTAPTLRWVFDNGAGHNIAYPTKYLSFNTPIGTKPDDQCGKAVLSDIHIAGTLDQSNIPGSCGTTDLTAQEKALLFLFMDLSSCVQNDRDPPKPPPVVK
jgi:hypothetical protein